jgi:hypothetical protein
MSWLALTRAVSPTLAGIILDQFEALSKEEELAEVFCPDGLPLEAGDVLRNPGLAESLRKIAAGGRDVFYRGELAAGGTGTLNFCDHSDTGSPQRRENVTRRGCRLSGRLDVGHAHQCFTRGDVSTDSFKNGVEYGCRTHDSRVPSGGV